MKRNSHSSRHGFSLIEVLVAMTILSIIVLIVARIFQQTGVAWTLGLKRSDAQSMTRAVLGAISRDLSMIVDPRQFVATDDAVASGALSDENVSGTGTTTGGLDFWILRPDRSETSSPSGRAKRELVHITYSGSSGSVTRTEANLDGSQTLSSKFNIGSGSISFESFSTSIPQDTFSSYYTEPGVRIKVSPVTPPSINDYEIAVGSCGPDGEWGTDDDIRPWVKGEDNK